MTVVEAVIGVILGNALYHLISRVVRVWYQRKVAGKELTVVALVLLLGSLSASAQAPAVGPVTAATKFAWDLPNVPSAAIAQSYEARTSLDGVRATPSVLMANVSCAASVPPQANQVTCQATLPQVLVDVLNLAGKHALVLRMYDPSTKLESPDSTSLAILAPPAAPTGIRLVVGP